jgi:hypothetical protein
MNAPQYKTVFDILEHGSFGWLFPVIALMEFALVVLAFTLIYKGRIPDFKSWRTLYFFMAFVLIFGLFASYTSSLRYTRFKTILMSNEASFVEGDITNFRPSPYFSKQPESFTVQNVTFSYHDNIETEGFNNRTSQGGPIHNGIHVRIWYLGNVILKLQIQE